MNGVDGTDIKVEGKGALERPVLTMPEAEAAFLRETYAGATVILEYGSGGSTVEAAALPGRHVTAVESDRRWVRMMRRWFAQNPPAGEVAVRFAEVGPTGKWGRPKDTSEFRAWPAYALSVWDRADFRHPDVVLIDGRFRTACFLTALFRIAHPVRVLFDDYLPRREYHVVERLVRPSRMVGRMAVFDLVPTPIPAEHLGWILPQFLQPD